MIFSILKIEGQWSVNNTGTRLVNWKDTESENLLYPIMGETSVYKCLLITFPFHIP